MKNLSKFIFFSFLFVFLILTVLYFVALPKYEKVESAVNPVPPPGRVECLETVVKNPEFHTLRPYQASPCADSPKAVYCSNDIIIYEVVTDNYVGVNDDSHCNETERDVPISKGHINKTYSVTLNDTEIPILGNTEQVKNSQSKTDELDDSQKMNEYVSWYLEGATQKAEEGIYNFKDLVNYSGPVKKILPSALLDFERFKVLHDAGTKTIYYDFEDVPTGQQPVETKETAQHSQIVVCTTKNIFGVNNPWVGEEIPIPCYDGDNSKANGDLYRLVQWWDGKQSGLIDSLKVIENWDGSQRWDARTPPFPWQFERDIYYQKAYKEWRGYECLIAPIINKVFCADIKIPGLLEWHSNSWADFYQYIPLGNTVDKNAKLPIVNTMWPKPIGQTVINAKNSPELIDETVAFYPHTKDSYDVSRLLNSSYIPDKGTKKDVDYSSTEPDTTDTGVCRLANIRTNEGDNLFPEVPPEAWVIHAEYTIEKIPCAGHCKVKTNKFGDTVYTNECSGGASITIDTDIKVPYAKEIFETTTAGSSSTFRRIFPKVEEGAPVKCIANMPAVAKANYYGYEADWPSQGYDKPKEIQVREPDGSTSTNGIGANLYFPYLGSVYEYFLKGIQTALRPKGYGQPLANGLYCEDTAPAEECDVNVPDSAVPSKYLGSFKSNFIDLANRWSTKCPGGQNNKAEECYNFVASSAQKAGVNPAFALTIWLNESGASNYCEGGNTTQDFGINLPSIYKDLAKQLMAFLKMASTKLCDGMAGFTEPMHGWLSRFQSSAGICDPNDTTATQYYYDVRDETWSWVTGCSSGGKFGITWPTDMSCP